jgi:hypothetical protein
MSEHCCPRCQFRFTVDADGDADPVAACLAELVTRCERAGAYVNPVRQDVRPDVAAMLLGRSRGTLDNWASAGQGPPFHRVGGKGARLYPLEGIARYIVAGD